MQVQRLLWGRGADCQSLAREEEDSVIRYEGKWRNVTSTMDCLVLSLDNCRFLLAHLPAKTLTQSRGTSHIKHLTLLTLLSTLISPFLL